MLYQCDKCKKQFNRKSNYLNHANDQKCTNRNNLVKKSFYQNNNFDINVMYYGLGYIDKIKSNLNMYPELDVYDKKHHKLPKVDNSPYLNFGNIYIISTANKAKKNKYKFGRHLTTKKQLISRYATYMFNPVVYFFKQVDNYVLVENKIKVALDDYILHHDNNNKSEWVELELPKLIKIVTNIIDTHNKIVDDEFNQTSESDSE